MTDLNRVYGREAVELCKRRWPDLFPELPPVTVAAPQPPFLSPEMTDHDKVAFLVAAYTTFSDVHGRLDQIKLHRMRAHSALGVSPQGKSLKRKLLDAANVMAGCAWGTLEEVVRNGKLPAQIAPHSWLLFKMQTHFGGPRSATYPQIDKVFSAGGLLNAKSLRLYTHTATDLVSGATRPFKNSEELSFRADEWEVMRLHLVSLNGISPGATKEEAAALYPHPPGMTLQEIAARDRERAQAEEKRLAQLASQGTWVWGRWLDESQVGKRYGRSVLMPALNTEVRW